MLIHARCHGQLVRRHDGLAPAVTAPGPRRSHPGRRRSSANTSALRRPPGKRFGAALTDLTVSGASRTLIGPRRVWWTSLPLSVVGLSVRGYEDRHRHPPTPALAQVRAAGAPGACGCRLGDDYRWRQRSELPGDDADPGLCGSARRSPAHPATGFVDGPGAGWRVPVLLVDYLTILGPATPRGREAPFDELTRDSLRELGDDVARAFRRPPDPGRSWSRG